MTIRTYLRHHLGRHGLAALAVVTIAVVLVAFGLRVGGVA